MFEVPIEKKKYAETHIPLKRSIIPVAQHYETSNYYGITDADYRDILQSIKHTGSTYERTPASYKSLHEEDLRNTLLAALNATYKGDATGETFRNAGKTDICIERENRAAFVAECKMWTGQKEVVLSSQQRRTPILHALIAPKRASRIMYLRMDMRKMDKGEEGYPGGY